MAVVQKTKIEELELSYIEEGKGEVVVLLHGYCGSSQYWENIIPLLSQTYRLIAPDLRGHGQSGAPENGYTMEKLAEDIERLIAVLQIERVHLIGHSLGGYITLAFAEQHSHLLKSFGLVHSTPFPDTELGKANRDKAVQNLQENGVPPFVNGLIPKLFAPANVIAMDSQIEEVKRIGYETSSLGAIRIAQGMRDRSDRSSIIEATSVPVLLVAGSEDQVIPPDRVFAVSGSHVTQHLIQGAGHMSMYEAPEKLAEAIISFLNNK